MNQVLLDTDTLSEILKGKNEAVVAKGIDYLRFHDAYTISVVTVAVVVKGLQKVDREDKIRQFMELSRTFDVVALDLEIAELAGRIYGSLERIGLPIGRADPLIAATAMQRGFSLVTGNGKHVKRITELGFALSVESWAR